MSLDNTSRARSARNRVWVYFKKCDKDTNKVRCNLCSTELTNRGATGPLWNHIKSKHSLDKNMPDEIGQDRSIDPIMTSHIHNKHGNSKSKNQLQTRVPTDVSDYDDEFSISSIKPLPSSSLSKNFISRLNQLSSPVTRKLKFWNKKSFQVNQYDPSFKVTYLGNLGMQLWSKDESCLDKPLSALWNNYVVNMKTEIVMRLTICNSGLKAITRQHGLTQYWSNRLVYCCSHKNYPRIFSWIYRHEGKKMRQELRCHAVFCSSSEKASKMVTLLNHRLTCALQEFRREKKSRGPGIALDGNNISSIQQRLPRTIPLRRQILAKGSANFRPPLDRSKSAPKLTSIVEEELSSDEQDSDEEFDYGDPLAVKEFSNPTRGQDNSKDENHHVEDEINLDESDPLGEEDSTQRVDSNSSATITNEETSNSSVCAVGDFNRYNENESPNEDLEENSPVDRQDINRSPFPELMTDFNDSSNENLMRKKPPRTKEAVKLSPDYFSKSQSNELIRLSSANNNTSCSFPKEFLIEDHRQRRSNQSNSHSTKTSNIVESQDQVDDPSTQEIVLSWSKFVIK